MLPLKPPIPPSRATQSQPYNPPSDVSTYRDLLLFEERLKMNSEVLRRRRRRYSIFLYTFMVALVVMAYRLVFARPVTLFLLRALQAAFSVIMITLILFFASGMYEEKIRYAHSYITHSNKALRPLNMHLNMRRPRPSITSYLPAAFRPAPSIQPPPPPLPGKGAKQIPTRRMSTTVMAQIPPTSNPRGELIFSSRVDRTFKEGYERYRAAFERRREERAKEAKLGQSWWTRIWYGGDSPGLSSTSGRATPTPPVSRRNTPPLGMASYDMAVPKSSRRTPSPVTRLRYESPERPREREESGSSVNSVSN